MKEIQDFIQSKWKFVWIETDHLDIYVRKSRRVQGQFLDIGSVTAKPTGKGIFSSALPGILDIVRDSDLDGIYVECVLTARFANFFRKNKWEELPCLGSPSFYLMLPR